MINIIRSEKKGKVGFTNISNEILQSKTLKPNEVGILVHLLSLPIDFVIHKSSIWKQMNIGRDQFDKAWKNLVRLGYIQTIKYRKDNSKKTFGYRHIVYEIPQSPENQCMDNQYTDKQDNRTLISSNWKSGCIQSNNTKDTGTVSNSRNEVEVRHGQQILEKQILDQQILDQQILDQQILDQQILDQKILDPGNNIEENLPIVPHPPLRCGGGRDNEEDQVRATPTKEQIKEARIIAPTEVSGSGVSIYSIGKQAWIQNKPVYDIGTDSFPEEIELDETEISSFMAAIDDLFKDKFPDWKKSLKIKYLHTFLQETSKVHGGVPEIIEMITIIQQYLKQNVPVR